MENSGAPNIGHPKYSLVLGSSVYSTLIFGGSRTEPKPFNFKESSRIKILMTLQPQELAQMES